MRALFLFLNRLWAGFKAGIARGRFFFNHTLLPVPQSRGFKFWFIRFLRTFIITVAVFFIGIILVNINFLWLFGRSPSMDQLAQPQADQASEIYTADSVLMGKYYIENRSPVTYDKISPNLVHALVATEDVRFRDHAGIDVRAIPGMVWSALRGDNRGGSTLTQQLAKNLYKTRKESSVGLLGHVPGLNIAISKLKEWITAVQLERRFTKNEILTMYFNTVDFGSNTFGIKTAARTYFSTSTDSLTINQAATLVGLLKAPTTYSPLLHPDKSKIRRNTVLRQMEKYGYVSKRGYAALSQEPIDLHFNVEKYYDGPGTYLRGVLTSYLKDWCKKNGYDLYTDGLKIYTTIDSRMQEYAEEAVSEHMKSLQRTFNQHWKGRNPWVDADDHEIPHFIEDAARQTGEYAWLNKKYKGDTIAINKALNEPKPMTVFSWHGERDTMLSTMDSLRYYKHFLHAGFMVMDPYSANIKAWVGGVNYKYFQYDHVLQAKRQPGSTFKPILYAAAFEKGMSPCDTLQDRPVTINYVENGEAKSWSPHNADFIFSGMRMTLRRAMAKSVNTIAAQVTQIIGWNTVVEYAKKLGITSPLAAVPSVGLGSSDVSVYELCGAYSTFLNHGVWSKPQFLMKICDRHGRVLATFNPERRRAISDTTAYLMVDMLKGGLEEYGGTTGELFNYPDLFRGKPYNELGGKTGTSSNHSDGWFVGVSKDIVGATWVGGEDRCIHFRTSALGEGAKTALPIFGLFMEKVYADPTVGVTKGTFPKPGFKITKRYGCRTRVVPPHDSTSVKHDSLSPAEVPEGI